MNSSNPRLEEFSSRVDDVTLFYQVLRLEESVFVWVGTEEGRLRGLVGAFESRLQGAPPAVSTLLGSTADGGQLNSLAERLKMRTGQNVLLSVNLPDEAMSLHVEEQLISHLSA